MSFLDLQTRRRFAPILLLLAAGGAGLVVAPHVPRERAVELVLDDASTITAVEVGWGTTSDQAAAVLGGSWRFAPGRAPAKLPMTARLPNGRYWLDVSIERGTERTMMRRVIELADADRVSVRVR